MLRKTEKLQSAVETYYTDKAERTSDTLGNIALIQSFARIDMEVTAMRKVGTEVLGVQMPVLWWWALATVLTKAATTITMLAILVVGIWFYVNGETTVGEIVMFMSFATMLIGKLEAVVHFANHMVMEGPRLQEYLRRPRHHPGGARPAATRSIRAGCAGWSSSRTSRSPMTASGRRCRTSTSPRCPARPSRSSARPAPASRPRSRSCTASTIRNRAR